MESKEFYTITEFAEMFNLTRQTLIHYDKIGLFKPARVNQSGYRIYTREQKPKMIEIMQLKDSGMSLSDIMRVMETKSADSILSIFDAQIAKLDEQIVQFQMNKLITHHRKMYYQSLFGKYELNKIFISEEKERTAFYAPFDLSLDEDPMIDAAYRRCVELTLQYANVQFQGCGIVFRKGACHSDDPYRGSGVFFMIDNLSADHPNLITLPGGLKIKKYFYGNPGQFDLICDVMHYITDHHYEVTGSLVFHNIVENHYIVGKNDLSLLEVPVRKLDFEK